MSAHEIYALVDVNNCYVSCQRVFDAKLHNVPVVVTGNGDGCIIARSNEAKQLGIKMGEPVFKIRDLIARHGVHVLSANFALYGEMSNRLMKILGDYVSAESLEPYSIDESFLRLTEYQLISPPTEYAHDMRSRILQWLGLPTCVGIGRSKTQAKLCNFWAKKRPEFGGVCNILDMDKPTISRLMKNTDVNEVWGIGEKLAFTLGTMGIFTVFDLVWADPENMKKIFSVNMAKTIMELRGISCYPIQPFAPSKQQIVASRSFGELITDIEPMEQAVRFHISRAASRLRKDCSVTQMVTVFIHTNRHRKQDPQYFKSSHIRFGKHTDDVAVLTKAAIQGLQQIYRPGYKYKKAGVMLSEIIPASSVTLDLFSIDDQDDKMAKANLVLHEINDRFGRDTLTIGRNTKLHGRWEMQSNNRSPSYLTRWDELMIVN